MSASKWSSMGPGGASQKKSKNLLYRSFSWKMPVFIQYKNGTESNGPKTLQGAVNEL